MVNQVNKALAIILLTVSIVLILPTGLFVQTANSLPVYTIENVNQTVEVLYSGQTILSYVISVDGQLPNDFQVGLPSNYSACILQAYAYDEQNNTYQIELGTSLGTQPGFYGVQVDINGTSPQELTLILILSNSLLSQSSTTYSLNYPAYPGLTQTAAKCNVTIKLPAEPTSINIAKSDGNVNALNYSAENLAAYTNEEATVTFQLASGYLQSLDITRLDRQITVYPSGAVTATDIYRLKNVSPNALSSFIFSIPAEALNVTIKDSLDKTLTTSELNTTENIKLINATLSSTVSNGQLTYLTAQYNLPSATIQGTTYTLTINPFPYANCYVDLVTVTFTPPEGAVITVPTLASLDPFTTISRTNYQESLIITRQGASLVNYNLPLVTTVQVAFDYNTVWSSFRPVIIILVITVIVCIGIIIWRKYKSAEKKPTIPEEKEEPAAPKPAALTPDLLEDFTDMYEERNQINSEIKSLDIRAKKGKIQRQQYKGKKRELETRRDSLTRKIEESKQIFRDSGSGSADLVRQLDVAESELQDINEKIRVVKARQDSHQISIEEYKKSTDEYQRKIEKIDVTISGILLRLREKTR